MNAYDESPRYESDGDGIDWHPVAYGPQFLWDVRWIEGSNEVKWFAYGDSYRAKFGHWNGDDETVPFWKVEIRDPHGDSVDEWVRCSDMDNELLAFTTNEGLQRYLKKELD